MKKVITALRSGPVLVGEFRGGKGETFKRFDKSDKTAPPIVFGVYKFNLEQLGDGAPVIVSVFLDQGVNVEDFAAKVLLKRRDIVLVSVTKMEITNGMRCTSCSTANFIGLDKSEADQLRS